VAFAGAAGFAAASAPVLVVIVGFIVFGGIGWAASFLFIQADTPVTGANRGKYYLAVIGPVALAVGIFIGHR